MSKKIDEMSLPELEEELKELSRVQLIMMIQFREQRIVNMTEGVKLYAGLVDQCLMSET